MGQKFTSVAASYARALAGFIRRSNTPLFSVATNVSSFSDTIRDMYCEWCPREKEDPSLEEKRGCVVSGGFANELISNYTLKIHERNTNKDMPSELIIRDNYENNPMQNPNPSLPPLMKDYPKINSIFKRGSDKSFIVGDYSTPEIEYLRHCTWVGTEKINGRNICIGWFPENPDQIAVMGRNDKAKDVSIPVGLLSLITRTFSGRKFKLFCEQMESMTNKSYSPEILIYGEGYGYHCADDSEKYIVDFDHLNPDSPDNTGFRVFDIRIDGWWLSYDNMTNVARSLGLNSVKIAGSGDLIWWLNAIGHFYLESDLAPVLMEGVVLKPKVEMHNRKGERIITKIKHKDVKNLYPGGVFHVD